MVLGISIIMSTNLDGMSIELNLESFTRKLRRLSVGLSWVQVVWINVLTTP